MPLSERTMALIVLLTSKALDDNHKFCRNSKSNPPLRCNHCRIIGEDLIRLLTESGF